MNDGNTHRTGFSPSCYGLAKAGVHTSLLGHQVVSPLTPYKQMLIGARPVKKFHTPADNTNCDTEVQTCSLSSSLFLRVLKCFTRTRQAQQLLLLESGEVVSMSLRHGKQLNPDLHLMVAISDQ